MNRATLKKLYREALVQVFGTGDEIQDKYLLEAVNRDIHLADKAPGQWSPDSVLEIYCEGGIPNATDIFDPAWHGFSGKAVYNADPNNNYDQKEFIFTPSVANTAGQNLVRQSYNNMKTLSDYDSMTDV